MNRALLHAALYAAVLVLPLSAPLQAAPRIVTSIAPLAEIAAAISKGVSEPETIIPRSASLHHFALRPSQVRSLQQADLVIWIDKRFESGFERIDTILAKNTRRLELATALKLDIDDAHLWYSPRHLIASVILITGHLIELDPQNSAIYRGNRDVLRAEINAWRGQLLDSFERRRPAIVTDHAFLGAFASDFGLQPITVVHDQHDNAGSLQDLFELEDLLARTPARCLLTTEAKPSPLGTSLARKYALQVISLSPAGEAGADSTLGQRLQRLTLALESC